MVEYVNMGGDNLFCSCKKSFKATIQKKLTVVTSLIIIIIIVVCMCLLLKNKDSQIVDYNSEPQIYIPLLSSINTSANPCDDFYEFSCGLWAKTNLIPDGEAKVTTFSKLQNFVDSKVRTIFENAHFSSFMPRIVNDAVKFYEMCIDSNRYDEGLNLVHGYLRQMGGWPILDGKSWDENSFDWAQTSVYMMKTLNIHPVLSISTTVDDYNTTRNIIYLSKPPVSQNEYKLLEFYPDWDMLYMMVETLNTSKDLIATDVINEMSEISKAAKKWEKMISHSVTNRSEIRMTINQFKEHISGFDLFHHLRHIMGDTLKDLNQEISADDEILIEDFSYVKHAISVVQSKVFSKRELADLFGWFVLRDISILLPGVFEKYSQRHGFSVQEMANAAKGKCFDHVKDIYQCSLEYLFVKNSSHLGIKESHTLIKSIRISFRKMIETSDWLDNATKQAALLKLDSLQDVAGFKDYFNSKTKFDKMYENFPTLSHSSPLETFINIKAYAVSLMISELKRPNDNNWVLPRPVTHVSAYYISQGNILAIPLSMYHPPFYYTVGPWVLNFGAIGSIIGHEFMHGFDTKGCGRGKEGSLEEWWSNSSLKIYKEHTQCFKKEHIFSKKFKIDQEARLRTLDENIADTEGLRMAFLAYKQREKEYGLETSNLFFHNYTAEQMFFIAFASAWCSNISPNMRIKLSKGSHNYPELRVNGAVSNSEFFATTFNCPKGSPMNPHQKCSIW